jgi:ABC-type hemin transport system ATPase subunit
LKHGITVSSLEFKNGGVIPLAPDAIVVITGPNNSGKSTFLDELSGFFRSWGIGGRRPKVIKSLQREASGSNDTAFDFLASHFSYDEEEK